MKKFFRKPPKKSQESLELEHARKELEHAKKENVDLNRKVNQAQRIIIKHLDTITELKEKFDKIERETEERSELSRLYDMNER